MPNFKTATPCSTISNPSLSNSATLLYQTKPIPFQFSYSALPNQTHPFLFQLLYFTKPNPYLSSSATLLYQTKPIPFQLSYSALPNQNHPFIDQLLCSTKPNPFLSTLDTLLYQNQTNLLYNNYELLTLRCFLCLGTTIFLTGFFRTQFLNCFKQFCFVSYFFQIKFTKKYFT